MVTGASLDFQEPYQVRIGKKYYLKPGTYRFDFTEWTVNTAAVEAEVSTNQIKITRFTPNTWLFHGPAVTGTAETSICSYCSGFTLKIEGLEANKSLFGTEVEMTNNHGAGRDVPYFRGLEVFPGTLESSGTKWYWIQERSYTWEAMWDSATTRNLSGEADNSSFRGNVGGHGRYGWLGDFDSKVVFPSNIYDIATWTRGTSATASGKNNTWYYGIGLYGGGIETDSDGLVTLSTPIILSQIPQKGINPVDSMCFDAYYKGESVYHKAKVTENTWEALDMLDTTTYDDLSNSDKTVFVVGLSELGDMLEVTAPVDLNDRLQEFNADGTLKSMLKWRVKPFNLDFWDDVREAYKNRNIKPVCCQGLFKGTNCNGSIELWISESVDSREYCTFDEMLYKSDVESIKLHAAVPGLKASSGHRAFSWAQKLTSIESDIHFITKDLSGMFEQCSSLEEYPEDLIDYTQWGEATNYGWVYEGCSKLKKIPGNRSTDVVKPSTMQQTFRFCTSLTYVGPVLNMITIKPDSYGAYQTFVDCASIQDIRIKNLNHGDWHFDGSETSNTAYKHGDLSGLNKDSITYLLENLADLTKHSDSSTSEENPKVSSATIYCPSTWKTTLGTSAPSLIAKAKAKGWTLSGLS